MEPRTENPPIPDLSGEQKTFKTNIPKLGITKPQGGKIFYMLKEKGVDKKQETLLLEQLFGKYDAAELTKDEASKFIEHLGSMGTQCLEIPPKDDPKPPETQPKQENIGKPTSTALSRVDQAHAGGVVLPQKAADFSVLEEGLKVSGRLKAIIEEHGLVTAIQGKKHVQVEGWQLLGALFGYSTQAQTWQMENKRGYISFVKLYDATGRILSEATAICTRDEKNWSNRDDYALYSMAQTRALGKAYRMKFGWIIRLSGYEGTPAEEMPQP